MSNAVTSQRLIIYFLMLFENKGAAFGDWARFHFCTWVPRTELISLSVVSSTAYSILKSYDLTTSLGFS